MVKMLDQRISPAQAAKMLGKNRDSIMALIRAGELSATDERRPGSSIPRYRIDPDDLERWRRSRIVFPQLRTSEPARSAPRLRGALARMREVKRRRRASESARA